MGAGVVVSTELEVVLASCNGGRFLDAQVQSLWEQQLRPQRLLVFDDGSSDATPALLQRWQQQKEQHHPQLHQQQHLQQHQQKYERQRPASPAV